MPTAPDVERDRDVFGAVRFEGLSYPAVADRYGCSVAEVEQIVARVLLALMQAADAED